MEFLKGSSNFNFMGLRKAWYGLSALLVLASLVSLGVRGLNLGVDFTGGVTIAASFPADAPIERIRSGLEGAGFVEPTVQNFGTSRDVSIRLPPPDRQTSEQVRQRVEQVLRAVDAKVEVKSVEVVGPQVGRDLTTAAWQSLLATLILIFIYVFIRFHTIKLSTGAIIAAMHDPIIVLGFFSWTWIPFDLAVVAAILAVIGYSLNDTVVVFDRIRERFESNKRLEPAKVLDQSVNQTLSRTIMTSLTTLIVVVVLLLLGGPVLFGFSVALVVGILVGTYSSIYVAAAVALDMGLKAEDLFPIAKKVAIDDLP
ncbi:MAG: protein translocase subunit SecF [Steroidobacteraceae bacterium]|jgi:preprotein translocase subunit SecF|nr:protein translocase subunit SecF [Steroidobacteraceae bacterium]